MRYLPSLAGMVESVMEGMKPSFRGNWEVQHSIMGECEIHSSRANLRLCRRQSGQFSLSGSVPLRRRNGQKPEHQNSTALSISTHIPSVEMATPLRCGCYLTWQSREKPPKAPFTLSDRCSGSIAEMADSGRFHGCSILAGWLPEKLWRPTTHHTHGCQSYPVPAWKRSCYTLAAKRR